MTFLHPSLSSHVRSSTLEIKLKIKIIMYPGMYVLLLKLEIKAGVLLKSHSTTTPDFLALIVS